MCQRNAACPRPDGHTGRCKLKGSAPAAGDGSPEPTAERATRVDEGPAQQQADAIIAAVTELAAFAGLRHSPVVLAGDAEGLLFIRPDGSGLVLTGGGRFRRATLTIHTAN
jgi:hypothetical protein